MPYGTGWLRMVADGHTYIVAYCNGRLLTVGHICIVVYGNGRLRMVPDGNRIWRMVADKLVW